LRAYLVPWPVGAVYLLALVVILFFSGASDQSTLLRGATDSKSGAAAEGVTGLQKAYDRFGNAPNPDSQRSKAQAVAPASEPARVQPQGKSRFS
jgi:hypothetical protein